MVTCFDSSNSAYYVESVLIQRSINFIERDVIVTNVQITRVNCQQKHKVASNGRKYTEAFLNKLLWAVSEGNREEVTEGWWKLCQEERRGFSCSLSIAK